MFETLGSYSWQTVHMSTQNGSHLEIWWNRILIHTLELKLRHFKGSPYGSHTFAMFSAHALREKQGLPVMHTHILCWRPLPDLIKIGVQAACLALLCIQLDYVEVSGHFFLLSVWAPCYTLSRKKSNTNNSRRVWEHLETWCLYWHAK